MNSAPDRHLAAQIAKAWGLSASWVRALGRRARRGTKVRGPGRPRLSEAERTRVRALVVEQFAVQGVVGWRDVLAAILRSGGSASTMLVQQETAAEKRARSAAKRRGIEAEREGHEVLARDAVWSQDTTHLGRVPSGGEVAGELITDRGTLAIVSLSAGPTPTQHDALAALKDGAAERDGFPLVWQHDQASIYEAAGATECLAREQVIELRSRAHTPTDNPVAEHMNGEILCEARLGQGVQLSCDREAVQRLAPARARLYVRLRASRGYRSAAELDRALPRADALVDRATFYAEACAAKRAAVQGLTNREQIEAAEQEAVWRTLERHGLARRRRGRSILPRPDQALCRATLNEVECPRGHSG